MIVNFFVRWFEAHGHTDVVVGTDGVGVKDNATRLKASLYRSKQGANGRFVVEIEFQVRLPSGSIIREYVAGMGDTDEEAVNDALVNFTLTTFHVVYKGFINAADPHMTMNTVSISGANRKVVVGDMLFRGATGGKVDLDLLNSEFQGILENSSLTPGPHWIKFAYGQTDGQAQTVWVTLDNDDHPEMTNAIKGLKWPRRNGFYLVKQFVLVK